MKEASSAFQSIITANSLPLSSVMGLVTHVILADAKAAAMASQIAELEARAIVANNRVIFTSIFEPVNMNAPIAYHRPRTNCVDPAITLNKPDSMFTINQPGDYSIAANLASMNGRAAERAIIYLVLRVYNGTSRFMFTDI